MEWNDKIEIDAKYRCYSSDVILVSPKRCSCVRYINDFCFDKKNFARRHDAHQQDMSYRSSSVRAMNDKNNHNNSCYVGINDTEQIDMHFGSNEHVCLTHQLGPGRRYGYSVIYVIYIHHWPWR